MVVGLDEKKTQHAGPAFDMHSSLILIEASDESMHLLPLAARRMRRHVRLSDSVLLLEKVCALLLPATPFSGAQAVANRISLLLSGISCELHVYHGATALLILQHLREARAKAISQEESREIPAQEEPARHSEYRGPALNRLPYLAFLTTYPSPHLLRLFPYELACRYQCVPVGAERKILTLATCHWLNREVVAQLRTATSREIFQVRCEVTTIDEVLHYWQRLQEKADPDRTGLKVDEACNSR